MESHLFIKWLVAWFPGLQKLISVKNSVFMIKVITDISGKRSIIFKCTCVEDLKKSVLVFFFLLT